VIENTLGETSLQMEAIPLLSLLEISTLPKGTNGEYIICYLPKNHPQRYQTACWQFEHRLIMEAVLNRRLTRHECIHHINGNKKDNELSNLKLIMISQHSLLHSPYKGVYHQCLHCGKTFYVMQCQLRQSAKNYCSTKCAAHSLKRIASAKKNLHYRQVPNIKLNRYVVEQKDKGRTWSSLAFELNVAIGTVRDRYRWYKTHMEASKCL
jgi:hypothetical protein